ncbi:MAG: glycerol-3-phosphate 1-O-acyltransferase PlsY, partial [Armatimonadetes bacterium]|nr:glycerol-3-phosphate 1-O-acyltransferase PlsY [Armatimonadota bacterium]
RHGSGNIGATNILRTLGPGPAALVFVGDTLKGTAAVFIAGALIPGEHRFIMAIAAGLLSIIGHTASPFLGFKGGKGVATGLGVIIGMDPLIAAIAFLAWVVLVGLTRYVSVASVTAAFSVPIMMHFSQPLFHREVPRAYTIFALVAAHLIMLKHRSNVKRLLKGTEPKFGQKLKLGVNEKDGQSCQSTCEPGDGGAPGLCGGGKND